MMSAYKNTNILVTGGAGFIGSHLVEALVNAGANVTILDDFSTGTITNLTAVLNAITVLGGSVSDREMCMKAVKDKHIIFHCAAYTSVPGSMQEPNACYDTNIQGTLAMLEAARIHQVKRFVFSSSSAVYGQKKGRCAENTACNPTSAYGYSKLFGEQLCASYYRLFQVETVCLRYFNVYGERQNPQGNYAAAVAKFRQQLRQQSPVTIFGDGTQTRDFVPVSDVVTANMHAGSLSAAKIAGEIVNVATGNSISILQLFQLLKEQEYPDFNQEILFAPARQGDIKHIQADCNKLRKILSA